MELLPGIYEQLINEYLLSKINSLDTRYNVSKDKITHYDPQAILSQYLSKLILKNLRAAEEHNLPIDEQIRICNRIIVQLADDAKDPGFKQCRISEEGEILFALINNQEMPQISGGNVCRPETSIAQSSLFTGSPGEPNMVNELKNEIRSADRIDFLVSFIKWSGIRLIRDSLEEFVRHGTLRVITTSYTGATDLKAVEFLSSLPNTTVKISYDTERTRLHAKSYNFHRNNGFSTTYIGSSNLSNPAITSGLEWNVKVTEQDSYDIIKKIDATFETYWNDPEFKSYSGEDRELLSSALSGEKSGSTDILPVFDVRPYFYQKEILETLKAEREIHNNYRNLIVAATGTGKTVISAFDYRNLFLKKGRYPRLLFVAHRKEILSQSMHVFRGILKDPNFGEILADGNVPSQKEFLFASIQSFNSKKLIDITSSDYYDVIIVDEFHHAASPSYQRLLSYYNPEILVGLTATPERMDGLDILEYFNNKISADIRLSEAINRKLLSPFHYFGITDTVNLDGAGWRKGTYIPGELSELYTGNMERVEQIIRSIQKYALDIDEIVGLGFCVSVEHAEFMAGSFEKAGIPSACLHSMSPKNERFSVQNRLVKGEICFIFVVDLYNEGIDIPEVNTILFLRPTESLTVFLQQLGRGLRLSDGKECLTVLDFIGRQNAGYQFGARMSALLLPDSVSLVGQVSEDSYYLPKGCNIHLERVAQERVLENIKANLLVKSSLVNSIRLFADCPDEEFNVKNFLNTYSLEPFDLYRRGTFCELARKAGVYSDGNGIRTSFSKTGALRLSHINSAEFIKFILGVLENPEGYPFDELDEKSMGMVCMFYYSLKDKPVLVRMSDNPGSIKNVRDLFSDIFASRPVLDEICSLLDYNSGKINFTSENVGFGFESPLELHCKYTRDQIFAALGHYTLTEKPAKGGREGVVHFADKKLDVFFVTLNKTEEHYSPTTMYRDYAVTESLFHWQSQSTTSESSKTGKRYIEHERQGSQILLFVREYKKIKGITEPYVFIGTARYVSHDGSRPMNILWQLDHPMPPALFTKANKMVIW